MPSYDQILSINLFSSIIDHISDMAVGVEQIIGIYSSGNENDDLSGVCLEYKNNRLQERELILSENQQQLKQMQLNRSHYKWLDTSQIPFDTHKDNKSQLSIFNEYDHCTLLITLPQKTGIKKNLVFIYFKDDVNQFGVQHQKTPLSTQNKSIIGHLISSSVISFSTMYWQQEEKLNKLAKKSHQIIEMQRIDNKAVTRKNELEELIISWAYELLLDCSHSDHVNYVYSDDAIEKIKMFKGSFNSLKKSILEAIDFAKTIITGVTITIEAEYITFVTYVTTQDVTHSKQEIAPRLQKASEFLDKLEVNTHKVINAGLNLTSYNVGQHMERPITPAAISDYISKNREKINTLFNQFPNKWSFIKNNFRPIINISSHKSNPLKNWG